MSDPVILTAEQSLALFDGIRAEAKAEGAAEEREACAALVEQIGSTTSDDIGADYIAAAIRARAAQPPRCL